MLTGKQRAFLRSKATEIDTTFQIGKSGVSENMLSAIEDALEARELLKIKCLENCGYTPREACDGICTAIEAEGVQCIGNKFVLFKISPNHRRYDLDRLCMLENMQDGKKSFLKTTDKEKKNRETEKKGAHPKDLYKSIHSDKNPKKTGISKKSYILNKREK